MQAGARRIGAVFGKNNRRGRPQGCAGRALWIGLGLLAAMLVTCMVSMVIYVIAPPPAMKILVMGLDSREAEGDVARTDSIMLLGVQPNGLDLAVLSIPRDYFIRVPGYRDSQRINTINMLGEMDEPGSGPTLLKDSIALSFGVEPTHYVRVDFDAFRRVVDAVGGVVIDVPRDLVDNAYPTPDGGTKQIRFEAGRQRMDGDRALMYARTRHPDDDFRRAERQQQVIDAVIRKAIVPIYWPSLLVTLAQEVETDLSPVRMLQTMPVVLANLGGFEQLVIDREYRLPGERGAVPDYAKLEPWLAEHLDAR